MAFYQRLFIASILVAAEMSVAAAQNYQFETFSLPYPASSPAASNATRAWAINNSGVIVGAYHFEDPDLGAISYSFKRHTDGTLEYPIRRPDTGEAFAYARARGINENGVIVGQLATPSQTAGFLIANDRLILLEVPGGMWLTGINNIGDLVGTCRDFAPPNRHHGFFRIRGDVSEMIVPFANANPQDALWPSGIARDGTIVGDYAGHGFLRGPKGNYLRLAVQAPNVSYNLFMGINNAAGKIVGAYSAGGRLHGFVWDYLKDLAVTEAADRGSLRISVQTIDVPDAFQTQVNGINASGVLVGTAETSEGWKGFVATPGP